MKYLFFSLALLTATLCHAKNLAWTSEFRIGTTLVSFPRCASDEHTPVVLRCTQQIPIFQTQDKQTSVRHYEVGYTVTLQALPENRFYAKLLLTDPDLRSNSFEATSSDTICFKIPARTIQEDRHFLGIHWKHAKFMEAREFVVHPPVAI